ncbi:neuritin-like [Engraulis encrasicolus]|uniref:neuritin-like n=1 Tax=Engraulis encrasicolus TaxID=184585 RepID=UPI002FD1CAD0
MGFMSAPARFSAVVAVVLLAVAQVSANAKCENIYKDFSDCVLELGDSMDNQDENVTSTKGVEAVCSHWEAFHSCALTALSECQEEVGPIWETLRADSRKLRFQGSLFDLCSPNAAAPSLGLAGLRVPLLLLLLPLVVQLLSGLGPCSIWLPL